MVLSRSHANHLVGIGVKLNHSLSAHRQDNFHRWSFVGPRASDIDFYVAKGIQCFLPMGMLLVASVKGIACPHPRW